MGKRERARRMKKDGLHEIKNKYRVHAVNKKRKGLVFTARKRRRVLKACASLSAIFIVILGVFAVGTALMSSVVPNVVPDDFVTVLYDLPADGSDPSDHSALENIGYMNRRFKNQTSWFSEMHGTTSTPVGPQSVNTFKQFSDGVLIMADVTSSSMVKAGRQFCYVNDEVMWREIPRNGSFKADSFEDLLNLSWNSDLTAHMTIPAFKEKNGLPGTEFSVYVINEDTLDHASDVELVTSDEWNGMDYAEKPVYKQTYYLRPGDSENLGAAAHYANQMAFTGGLTGLPQFNYITVTYTFDSSWQVLRAEVSESYTATMGITVNCSSEFKTNYEYLTDKAKSEFYETYFKDFVGKGIDDNVEKPLDALGCITSAFLTEPVTLGIDLEINGKKTDGVISLDASKLDIGKIMNGDSVDIGAALGCIGLKAKIGGIYLYLEDSTAYLAVGDLKAKLPIGDLLSLIGGETALSDTRAEGGTEGEAEEASVFEMGELVVNETADGKVASLACKLDLSSLGVDLKMPLDFVFTLDENNNASLRSLDLSLSFNGIDAKIGIAGTDKSVPALENRDSYINLYPYAEAVYELIAGGKLDLGISYENADMRLSGGIGIDFTNGLLVAGELDLSVRSASKKVVFALQNGKAYLNLDGIRLSVPVSDAVNLIKGFLDTGSSAEAADLSELLGKVLSAVFDYDLASLFSLTEEENVLTLGIKGTELLSVFGVDFALGDANLKIDRAGVLSVNALGAEIILKKAEKPIVFDNTGYIDVMPYAETLADLLNGETLTVEVEYRNHDLGGKELSVGGNIAIGLSPLKISGEISLAYGALAKKAEIVYGEDGYLYLVLDALKVKANAKEAAALFSSVLTTENESAAEKADVYAILEKVLSVNFGEILRVFETTEEGNPVLNAVVDGSRLLNLFGVNFELGEVILKVGAGKVGASVSGANITLMSGGTVKELPEEEKAVFADLKPVLEKLPALLDKKALSLNGRIVLTAGETDVLLSVNKGVLSSADGFSLYLDASLVTSGLELDLLVSLDKESVKIALGNLGAELKYSDLNLLGDEVLKLYRQIRNTLNPVSDTELLPEARSVKELFNLLASLLPKSGDGFALDSLLSGLSIENSEKQNGLLAVKFMGATLDLLDGGESGLVDVALSYQKEGFEAEGYLSSAVYAGKTPAMPAIDYLGADDFAELLDYLAAAVNTFAESNLNFTLSGKIGGEGEAYPDGVKYNLAGEVRLYSGENTAIHLNLDKKSLWVDTDTYLYANVSLDPVSEQDKGFYLQFYLLDCDENGEKDGEILDCFVSVSLRKKNTASKPLTLYAPVNEIMPILSSAFALLGADGGVIKDYILSPWLSNETLAQLKGFGKSILGLVGGTAGVGETGKGTLNLNALVSALKVSDTSFELALDSEAIFGKTGEPLKIVLGKETGENGSRLTLLSLENIGTTSVSVGIGYEDKGRLTPEFKGMFSLNGIGSLLQTLARSATHPVENDEIISGEEGVREYELNKYFYIDGSIQLDINAVNLLKEKINIKLVAFSITVDDEGVWGVNVRFEYDALKVLGITAINGNTQVDLTGKDNMVYIKRVQTTDADSKPFAKPVVTYRAMPLSNFVNDLIGQAGFLFNLGSKITDLLGGIDMGGSSGGAEEETDLGATVENLLKSIDYVKSDRGESWTITLNGAGLTGGTLGDIVITLGADADGKLRTLKANTSLSATGISLKIDANLTYRNPCGVMDAGVKDVTTDIAALLTDGMSYKLGVLAQNGWEGTTFVEGDFTMVEFILAGKPIFTQNIVISTGAGGDARGTVYGTLAYPDLTPYDTKGYKAEWVTVYGKDDPLPESRQIFARYSPLTYEISFVLKDETLKLDYLYDDDDFELPFRSDAAERVVYFTDAEGNEYRTAEDLTNLSGDTVLTAVYEKIPYTVTFVLGDEVREETLYYGDALTYPASPEKVGYSFAGWDAEPATVTGNLTITALWTANEYTVTLVSRYAIEGFDWTQDGKGNYKTAFTFVYDSEVLLPRNVRTEVNGHSFVLRGFCTAGSETCYFEKLPNVTEDTLFTAQWEELGYDITFVSREGAVTTLNYRGGDIIESSAIPEIPARDGYTSYWKDEQGNRIADVYRVNGEACFVVCDIANEYRVTAVSTLPYAGFEAFDGGYKKEFVYTYDGQAVVFDVLGDIHGYWFGGYYTKPDGEGDRVEKVEGILSDTVYYAYWMDNTVTVTICSDVGFAGSEFNLKKNAYIKRYTFNDNYDLKDSHLPTVQGYQTLALWHETENGFERVTNVRDLNGADLWVLWIKNINVTVTQFYTNVYMGGSRYNIAGTVEGGQVYGSKSLEIFGENGTERMTAIVDVMGANASDGNGNLDWGGTLDLVYGSDGIASFELLNQNCFNYADGWGKPRATYGGAAIVKTFICGGEAVTTSSASFVSLESYTVTFTDGKGNSLGVAENIRIDCPFPYVKDGVSYYSDDRIFVDLLAEELGVPIPEKEGFTGVWAHEEVRGNMTVAPIYTAEICNVTLRGGEEFKNISGWNYDEVENDYFITFDMQYGETVELIYRNEVLKTFTVGLNANVFNLAPYLPDGVHCQAFATDMQSFGIILQSDPDTLVMQSAIAYTLGGVTCSERTVEFDTDYTLPEIVCDGYVFLGWWKNENGVWSTVESVQYCGGNNTVVVEALWRTNDALVLSEAQLNSIGSKYAGHVKAEGGYAFVGNPASAVKARATNAYFVCTSGGVFKTQKAKEEYDFAIGASNDYTSGQFSKSFTEGKFIRVEVSVEYYLNGLSLGRIENEIHTY